MTDTIEQLLAQARHCVIEFLYIDEKEMDHAPEFKGKWSCRLNGGEIHYGDLGDTPLMAIQNALTKMKGGR